MVAWASRLFVRSRRHGLSLPCPWGRNGSGSVTPTQRKTSRTRCVWGNTVVPERPSPSQRARPFHSHSIQTPASPFSIAKGVQTQASPFHLSRGVHISLVFWVGHLFQPFFIIVWWLDCLFCRFPGPKPVVPSLAQDSITFHCHRVPDSFQLPHCDGFVEVRPRDPLDLVRAPLVFVRYRACFLLEGERSWEIFLGFARSCTKPPSWDSGRAYRSFPLGL